MRAPLVVIAFWPAFVGVVPHADSQEAYAPAKVVYDLSSPDPDAPGHLFDRVSLLQNLYGNDPLEASIIIVVHEGAIPLFVRRERSASPELMRRSSSLTMGKSSSSGFAAPRLECKDSARVISLTPPTSMK